MIKVLLMNKSRKAFTLIELLVVIAITRADGPNGCRSTGSTNGHIKAAFFTLVEVTLTENCFCILMN